MNHLDVELQLLKSDVLTMFNIVESQLEKSMRSLVNFDKDLAREVVANEKRVNAYELKIDRDCENIFALFNPVAIDLRFVLAVLKINSNLERIGDIAESIAKFVIDIDANFEDDLLKVTKVLTMYETSINMMRDVTLSFETEDTQLARSIFKQDEKIDEVNSTASHVIAEFISKNAKQVRQALHILSMIRKLERVGDQVKNIAEEIIFFVEAKVLKHNTKPSSEKK